MATGRLMPPDNQLSFEEKLGMLVEGPWTEIAQRVKQARLSLRASPEQIICDPARGLDKPGLRELTPGASPCSVSEQRHLAHLQRTRRTSAAYLRAVQKKSLVIGSPAAGPRYAALLTLALNNCALRGLNPFVYFTELFDRLAAGWPNTRVLELLPQLAVQADETVE
jgi:hypothetical protein